MESLSDSTPFFLYRRDISSFYEHLAVSPLRERLLADFSLPRIFRHYISLYFDTFCPPGSTGVPRGIGLSTVIAEMALQSLDHGIAQIPGVFQYFRFCDDIIILSYRPVDDIDTRLRDALPAPLTINAAKSVSLAVTNSGQQRLALTYLGYELIVDNRGTRKPRDIEIRMSPAKVKKLKSRIVLSVKGFLKDDNFPLLIDRLRFLAGNYRVRRHGLLAIRNSRFVKSGIFYSYRYCGKYPTHSGTVGAPMPELESLDTFLRLLTRGRNALASRLSTKLKPAHYDALRQISFRAGFRDRNTVRLDPERVSEIKRAWKNV